MFITPSFRKSLIAEQFQGNYLKFIHLKTEVASPFESFHSNDADVVLFQFEFKLIYCLRKYELINYKKTPANVW